MVAVEQSVASMKGGFVVAQPAARRLGEYIRELREARGWKMEYVARQLDWSSSYVQYLETKKMSFPEPSEIEQLARLFDVPKDDLMARAGYLETPVV